MTCSSLNFQLLRCISKKSKNLEKLLLYAVLCDIIFLKGQSMSKPFFTGNPIGIYQFLRRICPNKKRMLLRRITALTVAVFSAIHCITEYSSCESIPSYSRTKMLIFHLLLSDIRQYTDKPQTVRAADTHTKPYGLERKLQSDAAPSRGTK